MKKDQILQFACFITTLDAEKFALKLEYYAKQSGSDPANMIMEEAATKSKYRYIAKHEYNNKQPKFDFMKARNAEQFPEHSVKLVQAGGYIPLQLKYDGPARNGEAKIIVLVGHNENDIAFYSTLSGYKHLNIYQAYFESCVYAYVLEYYVPEAMAATLLQELKLRTGIEAASFTESLVPIL